MTCPDCEETVREVGRHEYADSTVKVIKCVECEFEAEETFKHHKTVEVTEDGQ